MDEGSLSVLSEECAKSREESIGHQFKSLCRTSYWNRFDTGTIRVVVVRRPDPYKKSYR